ncbi:MAG: hypothetical protein NZ898_15175 [Myxococcota bacterium]|nr:hypothetical protein [Myxococcota bacterium]MDW8361955.1 hypothetical protein [Myxococcales bacterium]
MRRATIGWTVLVAPLLAGCGGAGPYGFARQYEPLDEEEPYLERATSVSYEEVRRAPTTYTSTLLGWFGVVTAVDVAADGSALVALTYRTHQARHLCADERESSCRVTVSERAIGPWTARIRLRHEDRFGSDRVWVGSLLRVYGRPTGDTDEQGGPVVAGEWYRHWPRGAYVTTGAAVTMRR